MGEHTRILVIVHIEMVILSSNHVAGQISDPFNLMVIKLKGSVVLATVPGKASRG